MAVSGLNARRAKVRASNHCPAVLLAPLGEERVYRQAIEWWERIDEGLQYVVATGDIGKGGKYLIRWLNRLEKGIELEFPLEDSPAAHAVSPRRISLIRSLFALATNERFSLRMQRQIFNPLAKLLDEPDMEFPDLEIDWRPLHHIVTSLYSESSCPDGMMPSASHASALYKVISRSRRLFPRSTAATVLDEAKPYIQPYAPGVTLKALLVATMFVPASHAPLKEWLPTLLEADKLIRSREWTTRLLSLLVEALEASVCEAERHAAVAAEVCKLLPDLIQRGISRLQLPGASGSGQADVALPQSGQQLMVPSSMTHLLGRSMFWIELGKAFVMAAANGSADSPAYSALETLLTMLKSYLHPSNSGRWQTALAVLLNTLATTVTEVAVAAPDAFAAPMRAKFVLLMERHMYVALYSKSHMLTKAGVAMAEACMTLEPRLVVEKMTLELTTSLQSVNEVHRTQAALQLLGAVLVPWFARSGFDHAGLGPRVQPEAASLELLLFFMDILLMGLDPNDMGKSVATIRTTFSLLSMMPLAARGTTAALFTDWALAFVDRAFSFYEQAEDVSMVASIGVDVGERAYSVRGGDRALGGGSLVASEGSDGWGYFSGVMAMFADALPRSMVADVARHVLQLIRGRLMMNALEQVRDVVSVLCGGSTLEKQKIAIDILAPPTLQIVRDELASGAGSQASANAPLLLWNLNVLAGIAQSRAFARDYADDIRALLPKIFALEHKGAAMLAAEFVRCILTALSETDHVGIAAMGPAEAEAMLASGDSPELLWRGPLPSLQKTRLELEWVVAADDAHRPFVEFAWEVFDCVWGEVETRLVAYACSAPGEEPLTKAQLHATLSLLAGLLQGSGRLLPESEYSGPDAQSETETTPRGDAAGGGDGLCSDAHEVLAQARPAMLSLEVLDMPTPARRGGWGHEQSRDDIGRVLHQMASKLSSHELSDVLGAQIVCECIRLHLAFRGVNKGEVSNAQSALINSLFETPLMNALCIASRSLAVIRTGLWWHHYEFVNRLVPPSETNVALLDDVFALARGPHAPIRAAAQETLAALLPRFTLTRARLLATALDALDAPGEVGDDVLTGSLYFINRGPELKFIMTRPELRTKLLVALGKTHRIEKLTVLARANALLHKVLSLDVAPFVQAPGPSGPVPGHLAQAVDEHASAVTAKAEAAHAATCSALLAELDEHPTMHWRHVGFIIMLLTNEMRTDAMPSAELLRLFLRKAVDELESIRNMALVGLCPILVLLSQALGLHPVHRPSAFQVEGDELPEAEVFGDQASFEAAEFVDPAWAGWSAAVPSTATVLRDLRPKHKLFTFSASEAQVAEQAQALVAEVRACFGEAEYLVRMVEVQQMSERGDEIGLAFLPSRAFTLSLGFALVGPETMLQVVTPCVGLVLSGMAANDASAWSSHALGAELMSAVGSASMYTPDVEAWQAAGEVVTTLLRAGLSLAKDSEGFEDWKVGLSALLEDHDPRRFGWLLNELAAAPRTASTSAQRVKALELVTLSVVVAGRRSVRWFEPLLDELAAARASELKQMRSVVMSFVSELLALGPRPAVDVWVSALLAEVQDEGAPAEVRSRRAKVLLSLVFNSSFKVGRGMESQLARVVPLVASAADDTDPAVPSYARLTLRFCGKLAVPSSMLEDVMTALTKCLAVREEASWRVRLSALSGIQSLILAQAPRLGAASAGGVGLARAVLDALLDPQREVCDAASHTLSGMMVCLPWLGVEVLLPLLDAAAQLPVRDVRRRNKKKRKGKKSKDTDGCAGPSAVDLSGTRLALCETDAKAVGDLAPDELDTRLRKVHAAVQGLIALLRTEPYEVTAWMVPVLVRVAKHQASPLPIRSTVSRYYAEFWRTHSDSFPLYASLFSADELETVREMVVAPTYFA
ncbi:uncharacterized protein AMSG_01902 [Thecamonas trahens ATCC 50062]|uniref:Proteasome activator subunit 4 n=1 Tax=Thecamonas trahens ATCC 50062 TaxID=461836 RepID=A0A0L0DVU1_THETB|nr:hypothetical protein AMSG_01902 [Thecamonas trahens ATCC 50062]KNC55633.1 hypothetical protein AMSG_01902 [Thecamonas trahens ATCC 50062]|eukprot:XP_013761403.1 hypothetical protein AMSG_01902 [Thecamonas trahens ATCC 50062]